MQFMQLIAAPALLKGFLALWGGANFAQPFRVNESV